MKILQLIARQPIMAQILRTVMQISPVRPNGSNHQRAVSAFPQDRVGPEPVARLARHIDTEPDLCFGLRRRQAFGHKTGNGRLVTGGGGDVGTRAEIGVVHLLQHLRRFEQQLRRPQRIIQIRAQGFEFGCQAAIQNHVTLFIEKLAKRHDSMVSRFRG
jgi:hypothetical protein